MIATDVNGDGAINDRAFIPNPATSSDAAVGGAMQSLLAGGSSSARACLETQLSRLASRGSCSAPVDDRERAAGQVQSAEDRSAEARDGHAADANPLGLADLALHGGNDIRGWGQRIPPDQNLLFVRGFDAATRQFKYEVNQRFGSTRPSESTTHTLPFISLSLNVDIGVPRERQLLTQRLDAGRGRPGDRAQRGNDEEPRHERDSQSHGDAADAGARAWPHARRRPTASRTLSRSFAVFADSVWTPVGGYLAALPEVYQHGEAYARYVSARERTVDYLLTLVPDAKGVLTASQQRKLPLQISNFLDRRVLQFLRSSSAGDGRPVSR